MKYLKLISPLIQRNRISKRFLSSFVVRHEKFGDPGKVLKFESDNIRKINENEILLKLLASPINPSDINMVEGTYGIRAELPAVGGNEGVAEVAQIGSNIKKFSVGDWVIPFKAGFGCWRTHAIATEDELIKVDNDIPAAYAATLTVNPATAFRLLKDFEDLKPGDVVIQNGANSMVGLAVIQIAKLMGIRTINIIRSDRPGADKVLKLLQNLGGDVNITDDTLGTNTFNEILADLPPCKLAFNCIGGDGATNMIRCLATNATVVTYGGMSKRPLTLSLDLIAYKQLKLKGAWMAKWYEDHGPQEKENLMKELSAMIRNKQLTFFYEMHDFDDFYHALETTYKPFQFRKVILNIDHPNRLVEHDKLDAKKDYTQFETYTL